MISRDLRFILNRPFMIYLSLISLIYLAWFLGVELYYQWDVVALYWPISITMALGSIIAGATAEGGGAVAFPVFTKIFEIPVHEAKTFGLMIQSVGMGMASLVILLLRIPVLWRVILFVSFGGAIGIVLGLLVLDFPPTYPRILFTILCFCFGVALFSSRWLFRMGTKEQVPNTPSNLRLFMMVGCLGGVLVSQIGTGIDMLTFIFLVLMFGIHEKRCIPTTVIIMAISAMIGFVIQYSTGQISETVTYYWLAAVPVVVIGAPLGSYIAYKLKRDPLIIFLLLLIALECVSTLWIIPFTFPRILFALATFTLASASFVFIFRYRIKKIER